MPFWERHRHALIVAGGFLAVLAVLWLFFLRGYATEAEEAEKKYNDTSKDREEFCPNSGRDIADLHAVFEQANANENRAIEALGEKLRFVFPNPLIPERDDPQPQFYVRYRFKELQDYVFKEFETNRRVRIADTAATLGFQLPEDSTESRAQDLVWLRQMAAVERVVKLLLAVHKEPDGGVNLLRLVSLRPLPAVKTGSERETFIEEHPVEFEVQITLRGLMRLLALCSAKDTFHVVQSLAVRSDLPFRETVRLERRDDAKKEIETRYAHYAFAKLRLASLTLLGAAEERPAAPKADAAPRPPPRLIPH